MLLLLIGAVVYKYYFEKKLVKKVEDYFSGSTAKVKRDSRGKIIKTKNKIKAMTESRRTLTTITKANGTTIFKDETIVREIKF